VTELNLALQPALSLLELLHVLSILTCALVQHCLSLQRISHDAHSEKLSWPLRTLCARARTRAWF